MTPWPERMTTRMPRHPHSPRSVGGTVRRPRWPSEEEPVEPQEYDELLRTLVRIAQHQETITTDLRAMLANHDAMLARQVRISQDVATTLARIEPLLARMIAQGDNGQEAGKEP